LGIDRLNVAINRVSSEIWDNPDVLRARPQRAFLADTVEKRRA
jgi:hypothetical protein